MLNKEENFDPSNHKEYCGQIIIGVNDKQRVLNLNQIIIYTNKKKFFQIKFFFFF